MSEEPSPFVSEHLIPALDSVDVLHVEDDPEFAALVATFLDRDSDLLTVRTETDPTVAVDRLTRDRGIDCVVCDYDMPQLNGLEVLSRVREERPALPFILFTGKGSEEIASEAISAGVTDYLQKGGTDRFRILANRIENAVRRYRAETFATNGLRAIETARDGISILDEDGYIQYLNAAWADLLGYEREALIGAHWETFYGDQAAIDRVYEEILPAAREGEWRGDSELVRDDGSTLSIRHTITYTEDGTLICTLLPETDRATE